MRFLRTAHAQQMGTAKSFPSKKGYSKVKMFCSLRAQKKSTTKSVQTKRGIKMLFALRAKKHCARKINFLSKKGYNEIKFVFVLRAGHMGTTKNFLRRQGTVK